jgi:hypothetical protein
MERDQVDNILFVVNDKDLRARHGSESRDTELRKASGPLSKNVNANRQVYRVARRWQR